MPGSSQVHPFASLVDQVPATCPRLLINRELVGEAMSKWDDGFRFKNGSRDWFYEGEADAGAMELARELGWEVSAATLHIRRPHRVANTTRDSDGTRGHGGDATERATQTVGFEPGWK